MKKLSSFVIGAKIEESMALPPLVFQQKTGIDRSGKYRILCACLRRDFLSISQNIQQIPSTRISG